MEALHDVVRAGKARYIGASSMYAWQFAKAQHVAERHGWTRFVVDAEPLQPDLPRGGAGDAPALPRPGRRRDPVEPAGPRAARRSCRRSGRPRRRAATSIAHRMYADADDAVVQAVADVAKARELPPAQVALAWMLHRDAVTAPIVGATKPGHVEDAVAAVDVELGEDEIAALGGAVRPAPGAGPRVTARPGDRAAPCDYGDPRLAGVTRARRRGAGLGQREDDVATGLMAALRAPRHRPWRRSRSGPTTSTPATTRSPRAGPGRNLDPVLVGGRPDRPAARHGAAGAEVAVVEGVMGLFDGRLADGAARPPRSPGCRGAGRAGRRLPRPVAQRRRAAARLPFVRPRRSTWRGWCSTGSGRPGTRRCCARPRRGRAAGARRAAPPRRRSPCRRGTSGW